MRKRNSPLSQIGNELVAVSQSARLSASEMLTQLFPYVREAARRMSTRAISRWLKENHGLDVSHTSIARALQDPERYLEGFAEFIEPAARIAADAADADIKTVLQDELLLDHLIETPRLDGDTQQEVEENLSALRETVIFLKENWFILDKVARKACQPYFSNDDEKEETE